MDKVLVVYYSRGGNVRKMAEAVGEGARGAGVACEVKDVTQTTVDELTEYDGLIVGSPTYYGHPAAEIKGLIDASVKHHGRLAGKVGGAFASCGVHGGGAETTVRALLDAMLIHGMIVQGCAKGAHYGPVVVGTPDAGGEKECRLLGERVAELVKRLR